MGVKFVTQVNSPERRIIVSLNEFEGGVEILGTDCD
jgi:hypothetical protein